MLVFSGQRSGSRSYARPVRGRYYRFDRRPQIGFTDERSIKGLFLNEQFEHRNIFA